MKKLLIALAIPLTGQAYAADSGFYLTAGLGLSVNSYKQEDATRLGETVINAGYSSAQVKIEKSSAAGKIGLGYQFNRHLAIDVSYMNLGTFTHEINTTGPSGSGAIKEKYYGTAVSIIGMLPTSEKSNAFVKLGSLGLKNTAEGRFCVAATCSYSNLSQKTTVPLVGIGANTEFTERVGVTAEWNHTRMKYNDGSAQRLNLFLVSGRFKF